MKALALSGGGTKFIRHIAFADANTEEYDIIGGVSAGAIAAIPIAMNMLDEVREIGLHLKLGTFFSSKPVNDKGGFTFSAAWRLLNGKDSAGEMGNLRKMMKKIITPLVFQRYQQGSYPVCYALAVSLHTGSRKMWNLKECDYGTAIEAIMASSSIPFFTPPVWIEGEPFADGGIRDHSPGTCLIEKIPGIKDLTSVYTRPENYEILSRYKFKPKAIPLLANTIDVMNTEISKNDEFGEKVIAIQKGIGLRQFFAPAVMHSVYDVNNDRLKELYDKCLESDRLSLG